MIGSIQDARDQLVGKRTGRWVTQNKSRVSHMIRPLNRRTVLNDSLLPTPSMPRDDFPQLQHTIYNS